MFERVTMTRNARHRKLAASLLALVLSSAGAMALQKQQVSRFALNDDLSQNLIFTIAGTGGTGFSGDNVPALSATLYYPYDLAVSGSGDLFIVDWNNHRVRKLTPDGIITTSPALARLASTVTEDRRPPLI